MAQLNKKQYLERLKTAAQNNRIIQDQTREYLRTVKDGGIPEPTGYTIEEEEKDRALQSNRAFENLNQIMRAVEVNNVMGFLTDLDELVEFNRFFPQLKSEIKGQKNLSALIFRDIWDRFKRKLSITGDTGILFQDPEKLKDKIVAKTLEGISKLSAKQQGIMLLIKGDKSGIISGREGELLVRLTRLQSMGYVDLWNQLESYLSPEEIKEDEFFILDKKMTDVARIVPITLKRAPASSSPNPYYATSPKRSQQIRRIIIEEFRFNIPVKFISNKKSGSGIPRGGRCCGKGIDILPNEALKIHKNIIFKGYGKVSERPKKSRSDNYASFGKYLLHLPSLYRGYLNIKYKTYKSIKNMPKRLISNNLKSMILHILQNGQFPTYMYDNLNDKDKRYFDEVVQFVKLEGDNAIDFLNYKSSTANERDKDIQRYELLRGELMSGNNNPVIIQELKLLVWKMAKDKNISKKDMNETMYMLAML
jgi:hypothetical protein